MKCDLPWTSPHDCKLQLSQALQHMTGPEAQTLQPCPLNESHTTHTATAESDATGCSMQMAGLSIATYTSAAGIGSPVFSPLQAQLTGNQKPTAACAVIFEASRTASLSVVCTKFRQLERALRLHTHAQAGAQAALSESELVTQVSVAALNAFDDVIDESFVASMLLRMSICIAALHASSHVCVNSVIVGLHLQDWCFHHRPRKCCAMRSSTSTVTLG